MDVGVGILLALSADTAEIGVACETEYGHRNYFGVTASALVEPSLGVQSQLTVGGDTDNLYWRLGAGGVYFDEEFPDHGTRINYVFSLKVGQKIDEHYRVYLEGRHYSNGAGLHRKPRHTNPGWDGAVIGLQYDF